MFQIYFHPGRTLREKPDLASVGTFPKFKPSAQTLLTATIPRKSYETLKYRFLRCHADKSGRWTENPGNN